MVRPRLGGLGIPPQPAGAGPHLHCAAGLSRPCLRLARVLDSLVRVSRRVGWAADVAADPGRPVVAASPPGGATRWGRTEDSPPRSTVAPGAGGPGLRRADPGSPRAPPGRPAEGGRGRGGTGIRREAGAAAVVSLDPGMRREACCPRALTPAAPGSPSRAGGGAGGPPARHGPSQPTRSRSRRTADGGNAPDGGRAPPGRRSPPAPPAPRGGPGDGGNPPGPRRPARRPAGLNPPGGLRGPHPFTSERFHALLNSLFKVLFNFPLRYLSAIGLVPVFSLRWSLPPALGCIPKQPDSAKTRSRRAGGRHRPHTVRGMCLDQKDLGPRHESVAGEWVFRTPHFPRPTAGRGFGAGLFPVHSPLLRESWLVSFPPLTNMLKFSGSPRPI